MGILLGFAPFLMFALAATAWGPMVGLILGAATSAALLARDIVRRSQPKILEMGTCLMFVGLAAWQKLLPSDTSVFSVRLRVDIGLMIIVLASIAIGKPFTLQYARERVSADQAKSPSFMRTNRAISAVWAAAFVCIVAADALLLYVPAVPRAVSIVVTVAALIGAYRFTAWYPKRARQ